MYVGALALDASGRVLSTGFNSYSRSHPLMFKYAKKTGVSPCKIYLHAELSAIIRSRKQIDTLIIARLLHTGSFGLAKPCIICKAAIEEAQIKYVYYTDDSGNLVLLNKEE